jgi:hypothetical protein
MVNVLSWTWNVERRKEMAPEYTTHLNPENRSLRLQLFMMLHLRAGVAQTVRRRATGWTVGVQFPAEAEIFSLLYSVQTNSWAHLDIHTVDTGGSFPGGKAAWA